MLLSSSLKTSSIKFNSNEHISYSATKSGEITNSKHGWFSAKVYSFFSKIGQKLFGCKSISEHNLDARLNYANKEINAKSKDYSCSELKNIKTEITNIRSENNFNRYLNSEKGINAKSSIDRLEQKVINVLLSQGSDLYKAGNYKDALVAYKSAGVFNHINNHLNENDTDLEIKLGTELVNNGSIVFANDTSNYLEKVGLYTSIIKQCNLKKEFNLAANCYKLLAQIAKQNESHATAADYYKLAGEMFNLSAKNISNTISPINVNDVINKSKQEHRSATEMFDLSKTENLLLDNTLTAQDAISQSSSSLNVQTQFEKIFSAENIKELNIHHRLGVFYRTSNPLQAKEHFLESMQSTLKESSGQLEMSNSDKINLALSYLGAILITNEKPDQTANNLCLKDLRKLKSALNHLLIIGGTDNKKEKISLILDKIDTKIKILDVFYHFRADKDNKTMSDLNHVGGGGSVAKLKYP